MEEMEKDSAFTKELADGCEHCRTGGKMVLLITGRCTGTCWYCPLSKKKKGKDVVYADEMEVEKKKDIIEEANSIDATGTGITGGDPLETDRTKEYIEMLKDEFGEGHHIHLYTPSKDLKRIRELHQAGLDEIRFHPPPEDWRDIEESGYLEVIKELDERDMDVGVEIPVIPEKKEEIVHIVEVLGPYLDFINLNELEFSDTNWKELVGRGYKEESDVSSAVEGSQETALEIMRGGFDVPLHYCSASFKDAVQLRSRIERRAEITAEEGVIVTEEGTFIKGIILTDDIEGTMVEVRERFSIPSDLIWKDEEKERLEIYLPILEEIHEELSYECYGIEEYPTSDRLEVERWPLDGD